MAVDVLFLTSPAIPVPARSAKAVKLVDALPEGATLLDGTLEASLGRISEGSSAKHTYTMIFTAGGSGLVLPAASVTYKAEDGQEAQVRMRRVHHAACL